VTFCVELEDLPVLMGAVVDDVIPHFEDIPHFLGVTVIKSDLGTRAEVVATSYWDDGLEGSGEQSARFVEEIFRVTGRNAARKSFDILYACVRDSTGVLSAS
jgi:hypothetical protein